jgi:hypothetical protein
MTLASLLVPETFVSTHSTSVAGFLKALNFQENKLSLLFTLSMPFNCGTYKIKHFP